MPTFIAVNKSNKKVTVRKIVEPPAMKMRQHNGELRFKSVRQRGIIRKRPINDGLCPFKMRKHRVKRTMT